MTSNISRPKWLTNEVIDDLRHDIEICPNPYTKKEIQELKLDGTVDMKRHNAYSAIKTLTKYGIPLIQRRKK